MFIPSIDLYDGRAVQWRQGKEKVLERDDVEGLLDQFSLYGDVAIVDLNAALGEGDNKELIKRLLRKHPCRVGGGIRDKETALAYLKAGASKIVIGTAAQEPFVLELPKQSVVVALDSRADQWLTHGWTQASELTTSQALELMSQRASEFLYTQVEKEGMLQGLDRDRARSVIAQSPIPVTVAGGVTSSDDIAFLHGLGAKAQIGMAIYTGKLSLVDCFMACLDFEKCERIPTIVQDSGSKQVLMMAYSTRDSIQLALQQRKGIYFSRSRNQLWEKGESSGHKQHLVGASIDCDGDTILFQVQQEGRACHFKTWSCFSSVEDTFDLSTLNDTLQSRRQNPTKGSYTSSLFADSTLRAAKLREETDELIEADSFDEVRWEAADLLYFTLVEAAAHGVQLQDIVQELRSRHGNR